MYRPNRIGPWPLIHVDKAPIAMGTLASSYNETNLQFNPAAPDATVRSEFASRQMSGANLVALPRESTISFGVGVNGNVPADVGTALMFGCAASLTLRQLTVATNDFTVRAHIGRCNNATIGIFSGSAVNLCDNYAQVPGVNVEYATRALTASINTSVIIGDFDGAVVASTNPILFGWTVQNNSATALQFEWEAFVSLQKYIKDIDTYDVGRI